MIEIYPSKLDGEPIERHSVSAPTTIESWLSATVSGYAPRRAHPISVHLNDRYIDPADWPGTRFGPHDRLAIYPEAKGAELIIAAVTIAATAQLVTSLLVPKAPKARDSGSSTQGEDIGLSTAKGNKVKINSPIREIAGRHKVYPDYLLPQRRYFVAMREQWVNMLLNVGIGKFDIPLSQVKIGDTPVAAFGSDVVLNIYPPGMDISGDVSSQWWHSAEEVGATSTGSAGLDLRTTSAATVNAEFSSATYNGSTVTIPAGAGSFPADWEAGMIVVIDVRYQYTIVDNTGTGGRDVINGDIDQLGLPNGSLIEILGDNAGNYVVFSQTTGSLQLNYADGSPAVGLTGGPAGEAEMGISYRGHRYRLLTVSPSAITVERLTDTGATDSSWPGFGVITTTVSTIRLDSSTAEVNWTGPFAACPDGEVTDLLEFDVMFPQGLFQINKYNNPVAYSVTVELEYRDIVTAGAWTSVTRTYNVASIDQIGFTEQIPLGSSFRPECRMRRVNADNPSAQVSDGVQWYGLRARLPSPISYDGCTVMTLQIRGGDRLSTQAEQLISCRPTRILPIRVGGVDAGEAPTRSIAPFVRYVANSIGYTDAALDLDELDRLGDIWDARGDFYDRPHDATAVVKDVLNDALGAGFAEVTVDRGKIRPARDELRTANAFEHMYTPQNNAEALDRQFKSPTPDDFDGVDVEYVDPVTWNVETVKCRLPGDAGTRVEKIRADGVTDKTRAWRIGMRQRRSHKYRRWTYSWGTELDALNSRYLSYVAVADDVPGYAQSSLLEAIAPAGTGQVLRSSEALDWTGPGPFVVSVRRPDGTVNGPFTPTRIDDYRFTIPTPLDFVPDLTLAIEPPHILFGTSARFSFPALVTEISPNGAETVSVTGVNYDARVYADDDGTPPPEA